MGPKTAPWALALGLAGAALAGEMLWRPVTNEQLRAASDLIISGKIVRIEPGEPGPESEDRAVLRIHETLAGVRPSETVILRYPGRRRGRIRLDGGVEVDRSPQLIRYDIDQEGVFYLRRAADGTYTANHPARFKPPFLLASIRAELRGVSAGG